MIIMPELMQFYNSALWIFGVSLITIIVFIWLFVIGDAKYGAKNLAMRIEEFGGVVSESFGRSTVLLWICDAVILLWVIYYFIMNWQQFYVIFASQS